MRHLSLVWFFALSPLSHACLWDSDTIASEKARFPGVEEVIFGNFPRHSKEFYEWRKITSEVALAADPANLALYDDLAVAQHKLGNHEGAIATMKKKDAIKPGLYETLSNTGTFYIYAGNLPAALEQIEKALAVNPDAHFGREKYQKWLIEWLMAGKPLGRDDGFDELVFRPWGFSAFVLARQPGGKTEQMNEALRSEAIRGVTGMMRFADFDNPVLQEALADLMAAGNEKVNATGLATLGYLHAAGKSKGDAEKQRLLEKYSDAKAALAELRDAVIEKREEPFPKLLRDGLKRGEALAAQVRQDEIAWIAAGKNPATEFQKKYLQP